MDNQQNRANSEQLRPSQDFKLGQSVTFRGCKGIVKETDHHDTYPIYIEYTDKDGDLMSECFTYDGRLFDTSDIELFGLEESDKPVQATNELDSRLYALLQTKLQLLQQRLVDLDKAQDDIIYAWEEDEIEFYYIEAKAQIKLLRSLIEQYKGLEEGR